MRKLLWLPLLQATMRYLDSLDISKDWAVVPMGAYPRGTPSGDTSYIAVDWDSETGLVETPNTSPNLTLYLYLRCKAQSDKERTNATVAMLAAYQKMHEAQTVILANLRDLQDYALQSLHVALKINEAAVAPDLATMSPYCGAQMAVSFTWKD